jgi:hypothetical protein
MVLEPAEGETMDFLLLWLTASEHRLRAFYPVFKRIHDQGEGGGSHNDHGRDHEVGVLLLHGGGVKGMDGGGREFVESKQGLQNMCEDGVERQKEDEDAWSLQNHEKVGGGWVSTIGEGAASSEV